MSLPTTLRNKLLLVIHEKNIKENAFFEEKPSFFVAYVAPMLMPIRVEHNEYVYMEGDLASEMYFVLKGEINFVFHDEGSVIPYLAIPETYYFGEVDLILSETPIR